MNKQKTINKFLNQEEINEICIEYLNFIVNESLPNILSFIDNLFGCNLFVRNEINLSFDSNIAYNNFLNQKIKTIFKLQENFMKITKYNYFLYNLTLKEFADLIDFNNNVSENDNLKFFNSLVSAIKSEKKYKNNRITCEEYVFYHKKPKINLNFFNIENNLNIENNKNKSKINLNDNNILNSSSNTPNYFKTSETSNNINILLSEKEKKNFFNYPNDDNTNIFQQLNNSNINKNEKIIESKLENEEQIKKIDSKKVFEEEINEEKEKYIFYENNNYYEKEMENWFQIANKKLSEN